MLAMWGSYIAFGVFFKPMANEFGWSRAMTSGAFSMAMAVQGVFAIGAGALNDRFGPRIIMTVCGLLVGAGYLLMSQLGSLWQLYLFYGIVIGLGMSGHYIPILSTVARWFVAKRTLITGIVLTGAGLGTLAAPPIATLLIAALDWRTSYIIMGVVVLVVVTSSAQLLRRDPAQIGKVPYGENSAPQEPVRSESGAFSLKEAVRTRQSVLPRCVE